jgi:hypothetical protein
MTRKTFLFVFVVVVFLSTANLGSGPHQRESRHFDVQGNVAWFTRDKNGKVNGMHV